MAMRGDLKTGWDISFHIVSSAVVVVYFAHNDEIQDTNLYGISDI